MFAYIDESGNTGTNVFDGNQPFFITAALITPTNFDVIHTKTVNSLARSLSLTSLHANNMGVSQIERCASEIRQLLKKSNARFHFVVIEKRYLVACKIVDLIFDSYNNRAVPWHVYHLKSLRHLMVLKIGSILDETTARSFFDALLETHPTRAIERLEYSLVLLRNNIPFLPDARSRQLAEDAISWALENPESIEVYSAKKHLRYSHLPNVVAFPLLMDGIDRRVRLLGKSIQEITHDRQSQFQSTLSKWHSIYSDAAPGIVTWPTGDEISFRKVSGSQFKISNNADSAGIQIIDTILWLFKKQFDNDSLGRDCERLVQHALMRGQQDHLTFTSTINCLELQLLAPTRGDETLGFEILDLLENYRMNRISDYSKIKRETGLPRC